MVIATYDIGTTAVKGVLVDSSGTILTSVSENINTIFENEWKEQDPEEWWEAFVRISRKFSEVCPDSPADGIIMSGQMQDVIPVMQDGHPAGNAILYSDGRAVKEAEELFAMLGKNYAEQVTGNHYDGSLSLPKIMWLKKNRPDIYENTAYFLISAKDYILYRLTGKAAGDVTACSTAGAMDIHRKIWDPQILDAAGISKEQMPKLFDSHELVGLLGEKAAKVTGFPAGTKVYAGVGDAGATTLASGIACPGEYNINLGTSGWVASISDEISRVYGGIFNLAAMENGFYVNVVPFLNAGNVHKWVSSLFTRKGENGRIDYAYADQELKKSTAGSKGVVFLPYLNGERFPVMDTEVKGTFLGITAGTGRGDLIRSCLEGVAFSIRQGIESIGVPPKKISVIGGGGRVGMWNQILADVLKRPVYVYKNSDVLPALALCSSVLLAEGNIQSYKEFTDSLQSEEHSVVYEPLEANAALYDRLYETYVGIYPMVKAYYQK